MQLLHLSEPTWETLRSSLSHDRGFAGLFVIIGPSEQMAHATSDLLTLAAQHERLAHYFLCSGSNTFRVPCYLPIIPSTQTPAAPGPYDVLENWGFLKPLHSFYTPDHALKILKETISQKSTMAQLILLECITSPTENEQAFLMQLIQSNLSQSVPVLVCIHQDHQEETTSTVFATDQPGDLFAIDQPAGPAVILSTVYLCGGRVAQHELDSLLKTFAIAPEQIEPYLLSHQTSLGVWWSYRHSGLAKQLERTFTALDNRGKRAWARRVLPLLPLRVDYPLFSIAHYTDDGKSLLSHYTLDSIRSLLSIFPREVLVYFRKLRNYARKVQQPDLLFVATVNYIATLMRLGKSHVTNIYTILCSIIPQDQKVALAQHALFFSIGQIFSREKDVQYLSQAADCYQRCQTILTRLQELPPGTREQMLASISNGSALVALKQGDAARALQIESSSLLEIKDIIDSSPLQKILLKTHMGDLLFRSFDRLDEAIAQYEEAHTLAMQEASLDARLYVAPRLARACTRAHAFTRAIDVLEELLSVWKWQPTYSSKSGTLTRLEILLPLAQAYLSARRFYDAARCYLQFLLEPEGIDPAVLKGLVRNLRYCLPGQPASFWIWVEEVIATQEQLLLDMDHLSMLLGG
jgi:tetratricopeptide (TPR) repeat protein